MTDAYQMLDEMYRMVDALAPKVLIVPPEIAAKARELVDRFDLTNVVEVCSDDAGLLPEHSAVLMRKPRDVNP